MSISNPNRNDPQPTRGPYAARPSIGIDELVRLAKLAERDHASGKPTILEQKFANFRTLDLIRLLVNVDSWTLIRIGAPPSHLRAVLRRREWTGGAR